MIETFKGLEDLSFVLLVLDHTQWDYEMKVGDSSNGPPSAASRSYLGGDDVSAEQIEIDLPDGGIRNAVGYRLSVQSPPRRDEEHPSIRKFESGELEM